MNGVAGAAQASRGELYLRLGRVSNLPTVWTNVLAGAYLTQARPSPATLAVLALACSAFYVGGMFLNDAFDRDVDARERPDRPIPSGAVPAREVFALGFAFLGVGIALVAWQAPRPAAITSAAALAAAIVLYDAWHKENAFGPVIMGVCRMLVYLTAAFAVAAAPARPAIVGALCLFAYLIGLTYAAKQESLARLQSLWPLALLLVPLVHGLRVAARSIAAGGICLALLASIVYAVLLLRGAAPNRFPRAVATLIAAISLVDALAIAGVGAVDVALLATLGWPATLALQRYIRGT